MPDTDDMVVLQFQTILRGKAARALNRLMTEINRHQSPRKSASKVVLGLINFILERLPEEDNAIIGVTSMRKE